MSETIEATATEVELPTAAPTLEFRNATNLEFKDITSEAVRQYIFPNGQYIRIENPARLAVSASGGHRVYALDNVCRYIQPGWLAIEWIVKDGAPHFDL